MQVLRVGSFLVSRIVLLNAVTMNGVAQEECKVGVEIEERAADKTVDFQAVAGFELLSIIRSQGSKTHPAAVGRIDETEAVEFSLGHEVQGNLTRGVEIVATEIDLEP